MLNDWILESGFFPHCCQELTLRNRVLDQEKAEKAQIEKANDKFL